MPNTSHPVTSATLCAEYGCGHIMRSDSLPIKRARYLYLRRTRGAIVSTRGEAADVRAALALMMAGRSCAEVRASVNHDGTATLPTTVPAPLPSGTYVPSDEVIEVLTMVAQGHDIPEIAAATHRAIETVRSLMAVARKRTGSHDSMVAAAVLAEWGYLD